MYWVQWMLGLAPVRCGAGLRTSGGVGCNGCSGWDATCVWLVGCEGWMQWNALDAVDVAGTGVGQDWGCQLAVLDATDAGDALDAADGNVIVSVCGL